MESSKKFLGLAAAALALNVLSPAALSADGATPSRKNAQEAREAAAPKRGAQSVAKSKATEPDALSAYQTSLLLMRFRQGASDPETLTAYQTLVGEIALQRGELDLATAVYFDLAQRTRDPQVLARTVEITGYARRFEMALEAARLWQEVEPESKRAQQVMISILLLANRLDELPPYLIRLLESDPTALSENLLGLNPMLSRTPDRQAVLRLIDAVTRPFPGMSEAHYAVAVAAASAGAHARALVESRRALELKPDWEPAALLRAQLLLRESGNEAIEFLQDFVARNPKARDAQLTLARMLAGEKRYEESRRHFEQLLEIFPDHPDIIFASAILALQQNDLTLAESRLRYLATLERADVDTAYFYLGQIAEDTKRADEALSLYARVRPGERYVPAQVRRARLLAEQGKLDEARRQLQQSSATARTAEERAQLIISEAALLREAKEPKLAYELLDKALAEKPDDPDFLYETALLAERLDRMDILEKRLRRLIELRPEHAQAYNALGYSLADRNVRLDEARRLIEKAHRLAPEDAYVLDSLGWVLYRQGDLSGALAHLQDAYRRRADPEVAAHLGEVLWALGRKDEARRILLDARELHPDHAVLLKAIGKFAP